MKYLVITISFFLFLSCNRKGIEVYVHHEGIENNNHKYRIFVDNKELASDSIAYTGVAPNFNTHNILETGDTIRLVVDGKLCNSPIRKGIRYYSFHIITDMADGKGKTTIVCRTSKKEPTFY